MRGRALWAAVLALLIGLGAGRAETAPAARTDPQATARAIQALGWVKGPAREAVAGDATIVVPAGTMYLGPADTRRFLELTGNLPDADHYTLAARDFAWFAVMGFDAAGYVKDDEKIEPDALLKTLREQTAQENEERRGRGIDQLTLIGWAVPPHYDRASHNLEWGTRLGSPRGENVNYTTRLLGRRGVTSATLVSDGGPALDRDVAAFRRVLAGFAYAPDARYEAYRQGDKVAEYGLAALVTGGVAAAALKVGAAKGLFALLAAFGKYIAVAAAAAFAALRGFFARLFGRRGDGEA